MCISGHFHNCSDASLSEKKNVEKDARDIRT